MWLGKYRNTEQEEKNIHSNPKINMAATFANWRQFAKDKLPQVKVLTIQDGLGFQ